MPCRGFSMARTDYHERINDPALGIDENTILVIRGSGPWVGQALPRW